MRELPRFAAFLSEPIGSDVAILGIPYDGSVSYRSGTRFGLRAIRAQSLFLWGYNNAQNVASLTQLKIVDLGDVAVVPPDIRATHRAIELAATACPCQAIRSAAVIHFDAHPDTWDSEYSGQPDSQGTSLSTRQRGRVD